MELQQLIKAADRRLVVLASPETAPPDWGEQWRISPWTNDECIEYPPLPSSRPVPVRLCAGSKPLWIASCLRGCAELWAPILDCLAADDQLTSLQTAFRQAVHLQIRSARVRNAAREYCFLAICTPDQLDDDLARLQSFPRRKSPALACCDMTRRNCCWRPEHLAAYLFVAPVPHLLDERMPESVVLATAALVSNNTQVLTRLRKLARGRQPAPQAMAASLLHATGHDFRPRRWSAPMLSGAYLCGQVARCAAEKRRLEQADLSHADLPPQIKGAFAFRGPTSPAPAWPAPNCNYSMPSRQPSSVPTWPWCAANHADFRSADSAGPAGKRRPGRRQLRGSRFERARFAQGRSGQSHPDRCQHRSNGFHRGQPERRRPPRPDPAGSEFCRRPTRLRLLDGCDLEYMRIPAANFEYARLPGAYLTGSQMPRARFRGANFAAPDWPKSIGSRRTCAAPICALHVPSRLVP